MLADITCDSDGKIEHFIDRRDVKDVLELHPLNDDDYYLGIFLVGAYQEILGDLHNLFGDTNAVQVSLAPNGGYLIDHVVAGRHRDRGAATTSATTRTTWSRSCAARPRPRCAPGGSPSTSRASCCASTRTGSAGYTYLEREVDASFIQATGQLKLVSQGEPAKRPPTGT